jgi:hypothetical protein
MKMLQDGFLRTGEFVSLLQSPLSRLLPHHKTDLLAVLFPQLN